MNTFKKTNSDNPAFFISGQPTEIPMLEINNIGIITYISPSMLKMINRNEEMILGKYITAVFNPTMGNSRAFHYRWQSILNGQTQKVDLIFTDDYRQKYLIDFKINREEISVLKTFKITFSCIGMNLLLESTRNQMAEVEY